MTDSLYWLLLKRRTVIFHFFAFGKNRRIKIQNPVIRSAEDEKLWREVHKYAELIPSEPEPNMGRLREIKEEIKNGTYLTPQVIDETAARLTIRLTRPE